MDDTILMGVHFTVPQQVHVCLQVNVKLEFTLFTILTQVPCLVHDSMLFQRFVFIYSCCGKTAITPVTVLHDPLETILFIIKVVFPPLKKKIKIK